MSFVKYFVLLTLFFIYTSHLSASVISEDNFSNYSSDGWSVDNGDRNELQLNQDKSSSKTFSFGSAYANTEVSVSFQVRLSDKWESDDRFRVTFNNSLSKNYYGSSESTSYITPSILTNLDASGNIAIDFSTSTNNRNKRAYIDYVRIDTIIPSDNSTPISTVCGIFDDMFQTRASCSSGNSGINFTNAGRLLSGSTDIILNNTSNTLTTCNVSAQTWITSAYQTCGSTGDCVASGTSAKSLALDYNKVPNSLSLINKPSSSTTNITLNTNQTLSSNMYNIITTGSNTNINTTFQISDVLQINTLSMTKNNTFFFQGSTPYTLEIGSLNIVNNGVENSLTAQNAQNIKIQNFNLDSGTNLNLEATKTIKMEFFSVGRASNITLKSQYIQMNNLTITESGSGHGVINLIADYIDIGAINLGQDVTLNITPYTNGKRVLLKSNSIKESSSSTILLSSGNYYTGSLTVPSTSNVSAISALKPNQLINFYINSDFSPGNNPGINASGNLGNFGPNPASNFFLFINGDLTTGGGGTTLNATIYIEGDATFGHPTYIKGALNANSVVNVGQGQFTYDQTLNNQGWGECDSASFGSERDFILRNPEKTRNIKGNLAVIGNTVLCPKSKGQCNNDSDSSNADLDLKFIYTDTHNGSYKNSSRAQLSIPKDATIKWAALYTQGYLSNGTTSEEATNILGEPNIVKILNNNIIVNVYPAIINMVPYNITKSILGGYTYGTYNNIPSLIGKKGSEVNGWISVGNIKAREGKSRDYEGDGLGNFGAWSLVVIYEDKEESLKNLSVFDGYKVVYNKEDSQNPTDVEILIEGFLTPTKGSINSSLAIFSGEGDKNIKGDKAYLDNTEISIINNNAFNSSITGVTREPSITNNQGIDIQNYNISSIIKNKQTNATVKLTSNGDKYFPSVVAFTTELYEPRVCYYISKISDEEGNTVFENKNFITEIENNKEYFFNIWISNMKKDENDTDIEVAQRVQVYMNQYNLDYTPGSTSIKNIGQQTYETKTDKKDLDIFEFVQDKSQSNFRVGTGANENFGGTIEPAKNFDDNSSKAFISFKSTFNIPGEEVSSIDLLHFLDFKASFKTNVVEISTENALSIDQCTDLNTSANVAQPPKGVFNVVNASFSGNSLNDDSDTALFTQVSGQSFSVKVVALNDDFQTLKNHTGDVNLSIISSPSYSGDPTADQALCDGTSGSSPITITFNSETTKTVPLIISGAMKSASFKISFESNGVVKHVCATDSFAVRPSGYSYSFAPLPLVGGKEHTLTSNAGTSSYDGIANQTISLIIPTGCGLGADTNTTPITFAGGLDTSIVRTGNIGDYNITVADDSWTAIDQGTTHGNDCIVGSFDNTPSGGLVGCNTQTSQTFTFSPKDFLNTLAIQNFNANNFTYISNDDNMSATITATITARLDNNATATAYTANCYAEDINTTISLVDEPLASEWLTNDRNATVRIRFFDTNTTNSELNATGSSTLSSGQNNFNNGEANITINFNFDRNTSIPDEPFHISRNDFNISVIDTNGVTGIDFNRTNDTNTTFYYGRVYAPDQTFNGDNGNAQVYYEVYCVDCNRTSLNIAGGESVDSINWFQNTLHVNLDGNVTRFESIGNVRFGGANYANADNNSSTVLINQGNEQQLLRINTLPYIDRITYTPHPWLVFNPSNPNATTDDFMVEFTSRGGWGGEGTVDGSDDNNTGLFIHRQDTINNQIQKRMDW